MNQKPEKPSLDKLMKGHLHYDGKCHTLGVSLSQCQEWRNEPIAPTPQQPNRGEKEKRWNGYKEDPDGTIHVDDFAPPHSQESEWEEKFFEDLLALKRADDDQKQWYKQGFCDAIPKVKKGAREVEKQRILTLLSQLPEHTPLSEVISIIQKQ